MAADFRRCVCGGRGQSEVRVGERQHMEVMAVCSAAGCGGVADPNGPADEVKLTSSNDLLDRASLERRPGIRGSAAIPVR